MKSSTGLRESGRRVPEDVALVGVDNWAPIAEECRPPLTSVDLNLREVGRQAGKLLLRAIENGHTPGVHSVGCQLVVRSSSAPASGHARPGMIVAPPGDSRS